MHYFLMKIKKKKIDNSFKHPSEINYILVDSQQARRVIDRFVGYKLSPLLWKKVRYGLSAGRVQSVAVRLIVERERERQKFVPDEYWDIKATFRKNKQTFPSELIEVSGKKVDLKNEKDTNRVLEDVKKASSFSVMDVAKNSRKRNAQPPLKTSTLQQSSANIYGFNAKKTMSIAQKLFEKGFITYHRADSLNLSEKFLQEARSFILKEIGKEYSGEDWEKAKDVMAFYKGKGKGKGKGPCVVCGKTGYMAPPYRDWKQIGRAHV